jgi:replicative DNA helicase
VIDLAKASEHMHNNQVEQSVLGCLLKDNTLFNDIEYYPNDLFYATVNAEIFGLMKDIKKADKPIDVITLLDYVKESGKNISITYVGELIGGIATTMHFESYVGMLVEYMNKRKILKTVQKIDFSNNVEAITSDLGELTTELLKEEDKTISTNEYLFEYINEMYEPKEEKTIKTGLSKIDDVTNGIKPGQLITIAAYTGVGKSIVTSQIILNMLRQNKKIALFSLEMGREEIINKLVSNGCSIEFEKLDKKQLNTQEKDKMVQYISTFLAGKHFEIYEYMDDINRIIKQIKIEKLKYNTDVIFLDLINRVTDFKDKSSKRAEFLGSITRRLKILGGQLGMPIIITAQINRMVEQRIDKAPTLSDIKESGGIAEDSDLVLGLYRDKRLEDPGYREELNNSGKLNYHAKDATVNPECMEIHILKGRNVPASKKAFHWKPEYQRIGNLDMTYEGKYNPTLFNKQGKK